MEIKFPITKITTFTPEKCPECGAGTIDDIVENWAPFSERGVYRMYRKCSANCNYEDWRMDDLGRFNAYEILMTIGDLTRSFHFFRSNERNGSQELSSHLNTYEQAVNSN